MTKSTVRLLVLLVFGTLQVPLVIAVCTRLATIGLYQLSIGFIIQCLLLTMVIVIVTAGFYALLKRLESRIDTNALEQAAFLDSFPAAYVNLAIFGSAALSLVLELSVIRWQATVFEFFAFYKNFGLLACFAGLGLGYALAARDRIHLALAIPLFAWEFALMIGLRFGITREQLAAITNLPFQEQLNMGLLTASTRQAMAIYFFLAVIFLLTALAFVPIGQLCGRVMQRRPNLTAYGLNLLGSLFGVVLTFVLGFFWTPPLVWYVLCFAGILLFHVRRPGCLILGTSFALAAVAVLAWPVNPLWQRIYSPYQLLEVGYNSQGHMLIRAAGHYYQQVHNLSPRYADGDPELKSIRGYYELPYRIHEKLNDIAIVGAGTGNDVAAALRSGARRVDAIEIDPAILMEGKAHHPEKPYDDPRVTTVINDARSFLRTTNRTYDMIVYGLLDSHTLLSHASSVRLDSFVYTVEGLREARARLKHDGVLSLSFSLMDEALGRKLYKMMEQAFDGSPPVCIQADYDGATTFLQSKDGSLALDPKVLADTGFKDAALHFSNSRLRADVSTDDWPFFYMPTRVYPISYLVMVALVLVLSVFLAANFFAEKPQFSHLDFFLLGVGFMLVETKAITELGLTFGNTWQVIGIVIASILVMAFLGNCVVQWLGLKSSFVPYLLLIASLGIGWLIANGGGFPSTTAGRLATAFVLTCPMFFSGIVFSTLLDSGGKISAIMAVNLLGAMGGGLLEYNSMYFGFRSLYLVAMASYLLAFTVSRLKLRHTESVLAVLKTEA